MTETRRLITIPFSHFCEKARWALDRVGLSYREEPYAPLLHAPAVLLATKRKSRTTPVLIDDTQIIGDSTDILQHLNKTYSASWLYPTPEALELEEHFDKRLGPQARALGYGYVLPNRALALEMFGRYTPKWQGNFMKVAFTPVRALMVRGLGINPSNSDRARTTLIKTFGEVSERLKDGRRYLCGDTFSAADLTFAALASPLLCPPEHPRFMTLAESPPEYRADVQQFLDSPAGAFALRMYAEERTKN